MMIMGLTTTTTENFYILRLWIFQSLVSQKVYLIEYED